MRLAVSNIALTAYDHADELDALMGLGIEGLEVAPSRVWRDTWGGLGAHAVGAYGKRIEAAGLAVVGLHSLFYDRPRLGLFKAADDRVRSLDFLEHLSGVCRDLGGRTLIWGGGRRRGEMAEADAFEEAVAFMGELCRRVGEHGTCFCFEPLGPEDSDFINSALDSLRIVEQVDHPALRVQLDAKALVENDEAEIATFQSVRPMLVHFHANEPGLGVLGGSGAVDHAAMGRMLRDIDYAGFVSIEQRILNQADPLSGVRRSAEVAIACYGDVRGPADGPRA